MRLEIQKETIKANGHSVEERHPSGNAEFTDSNMKIKTDAWVDATGWMR
jgi:hypothetical protein